MSEAKKFNSAILLAPAISMVMAASIPHVEPDDRPDAFRIIYLVIAFVVFVIAIVALIMGYCKGSSFKEEIFNPHAIHFYSSIPLFWGAMVYALDSYIKSSDKEDAYWDWLSAARYVYIILMCICLLFIGISYLWHFGPDCFNFEAAITLAALCFYPAAKKYYGLWEWGSYFQSHQQIMVMIMMILLLKNLNSSKDYVLNAVALASTVMYLEGFMNGFLLMLVLLVLMFPKDYVKFITIDNWLPVIWSPIAFGLYTSTGKKSASFYQDSINFLHILLSIPAQILMVIYVIMAALGKTKN